MKNKDTMFVRKISLLMANPKRFINLIVPLLRQSKRRRKNIFRQNYSDDRKSMSIYGGGGKCHKQIMDLAVYFHWEHLSTYTQSYWFPSNERHFSGNTCRSICVKKHLIPNVIAYLIFGPLYLAMYYTGSVNWMEVFKNICWSQKKHPKTLKHLCLHFSLPDFVQA